MADAVTSKVILDSKTHYVIHLTNVSDGTGESAVVKVDKSAIGVSYDGAEANSLDIERIEYSCQGFTYIRLHWDHTTDDTITVLNGNGNGVLDFMGSPQQFNGYVQPSGLPDPRTAGETGDILLTTVGHSANDTYAITLFCRKAHV